LHPVNFKVDVII